MLGKVFSVTAIISVVSALLLGNVENVSTALAEGVTDAVKISLSLMGTMCFWNGIMKVFDQSGVTAGLTKLTRPVFRLVYSKKTLESPAGGDICASFVSNFLGLGNAALPLGLKAMKSIKQAHGNKISPDMITFAVVNTAPFQLIPTTLIALRSAHGSVNPFDILVPMWIVSGLTVAFAVMLCKILSHFAFRGEE